MAVRIGMWLSCRNGDYYIGSGCKIVLFLPDDFCRKPTDRNGHTFGRMEEFGLQKIRDGCALIGQGGRNCSSAIGFSLGMRPGFGRGASPWRRRSCGFKPGREYVNASSEQ